MTDLEVPAYVAKCKCGCGGNIYAGVLTNDRVGQRAALSEAMDIVLELHGLTEQRVAA